MARATLRAFFLAFCLLGIWAPRSASAWHSNVTNPNNTSLLFPNKNYTFLTINDPLYGVRNVSYWEAFDGLAIIDGDVLYGTVEELLSHNVTGQEPLARRAHSIFRTVNPWASATVTYQFSNAATQTLVGSIVNSAIANWKATAPYLSFKRIADSATAQNGVVQINAVPCGGCFSSKIGFYNIPLVMNLQQSCGTSTSGCGVAQATHEFGHILGK